MSWVRRGMIEGAGVEGGGGREGGGMGEMERLVGM